MLNLLDVCGGSYRSCRPADRPACADPTSDSADLAAESDSADFDAEEEGLPRSPQRPRPQCRRTPLMPGVSPLDPSLGRVRRLRSSKSAADRQGADTADQNEQEQIEQKSRKVLAVEERGGIFTPFMADWTLEDFLDDLPQLAVRNEETLRHTWSDDVYLLETQQQTQQEVGRTQTQLAQDSRHDRFRVALHVAENYGRLLGANLCETAPAPEEAKPEENGHERLAKNPVQSSRARKRVLD